MDAKETTGYLCRWCLLALAAAMVLASSAAIVAEVTSVPARADHDVVISDALWAQPGMFGLSLYGQVAAGPAGWEANRFLARGANRGVSLVPMSPVSVWLRPSAFGPPVGGSEIEIMPIPYAREAFGRWSVQLVGLAGGERVYMIDANMAALAQPTPSPQLLGLLEDLARRGRVVFICSGVGERFADFRRLVDRLDGQAMLICTNRLGPTTSLDKAYLDKSGLSHVRGRLTVITDDPACARQTASAKVRTPLVGRREGRRLPDSDYLTQHDTFRSLRAHFDWLPAD